MNEGAMIAKPMSVRVRHTPPSTSTICDQIEKASAHPMSSGDMYRFMADGKP
jgi:hypothetical protein